MTDQPKTAEDVKALVQERDIRFIRFWFTDILGQLKSFSINAAELDSTGRRSRASTRSRSPT
jgi:glutamine synthetase